MTSMAKFDDGMWHASTTTTSELLELSGQVVPDSLDGPTPKWSTVSTDLMGNVFACPIEPTPAPDHIVPANALDTGSPVGNLPIGGAETAVPAVPSNPSAPATPAAPPTPTVVVDSPPTSIINAGIFAEILGAGPTSIPSPRITTTPAPAPAPTQYTSNGWVWISHSISVT